MGKIGFPLTLGHARCHGPPLPPAVGGHLLTDALAILAPVSGKFKSLTPQRLVAPGDVLFEFEAADYDADRQRLQLVAQSLAASMRAAADGGDLDLSIREKSEIVEKHAGLEASLQRLQTHHANVIATGETGHPMAQESMQTILLVNSLLADARAALAESVLNLQRAHWTLEDFRHLQPIVERIHRFIDEDLRQTMARLKVLAPAAGELEYVEPAGWIERGAVMARYKPAGGARVERAAQSATSGYLLRHLVQEGGRVKVGDAVAELDVSDLDLQTLYLELAQAQQAVKSLRLEDDRRDAFEEVLNARLESAQARMKYQQDQVVRAKRLFESGFVSVGHVREAEVAFDSAVLDRERVTANALVARRALQSAREALDLQSMLGDIRSNELMRQRDARIVRTTRAGRVRWLVTERSYVSVGTWVAGVSA